MLRDGYVWFGVGAQSVGVNSQGGLKAWDPARYGSLIHPGDAYSYDIFTQAGAALRQTTGGQPLAGLTVQKIIADGRLPDDVAVGDLLVTPVTGAYGASMASNYNKVPRPAVVFLRDGTARVVVRRETYDDLVRLDA